jgi:predicted transcriptional regulator
MKKSKLVIATTVVINKADEVMGREKRFVRNEESTEATKNKNEAYSKMIQRRKYKGAEER